MSSSVLGFVEQKDENSWPKKPILNSGIEII